VLEHALEWREPAVAEGTAPFGSLTMPGEPLALCHGSAFGSLPSLRLLGCCRDKELDFGFIIKAESIFGKS